MTDAAAEAAAQAKRPARDVSNEEYRRAWADPEIQAVVRSVTYQFRNQLGEHDLESCAMRGLWKALRHHDDAHSSGQKFTTSLWRWTNRVCLNLLQKEKRYKRRLDAAVAREAERRGDGLERPPEPEAASPAERVLAGIPEGYRDILREHYLEGKSLAAIAAERGFGYDWLRAYVAGAVGVCRFAAEQAGMPVGPR